MKKTIIFILVIFTCLAALQADLEVGLPPGTPLDWIHNKLPRRTMTEHPNYVLTGTLPPKKSEEPKPSKEVEIVETQTQKLMGKTLSLAKSYAVAFDPFSLDMAASRDMVAHISWVDQKENFTPVLDYNLRQLLIVAFVRMMLHPEMCPEAQTAEYLIEIGQPALVGVKAGSVSTGFGGGDASMPRRVAAYLQDVFNNAGLPATQPPPPAATGQTPFETMLNRLIAEELGNGYYYSGAGDFAKRLRALGETIYPYLITTAKNNPHSLTRQNAVSLLGQYDNAEVITALRGILRNPPDLVCRNRALSALIGKQDKEIVPWLIDALSGGDIFFRTYAAYGLGAIGDSRALTPLCDYINANPNDKDTLWAGLPALGRLSVSNEESLKILRQAAQSDRFAVKSMALLSLAALREPAALQQLQIKKGGNPFSSIELPCYYFAVEVLGRLGGAENEDVLIEIVNSKSFELQLRLYAFQNINFAKKNINFLKTTLGNKDIPAVIRAYALYKLFSLEQKDAKTYANQIIQLFITEPKPLAKQGIGAGFDVVMALRVLGALNQNSELTLKNIVNKIVSQKDSEKPDSGNTVYIAASAPVVETAILELGRVRSSGVTKFLTRMLDDFESPYRAEAALALGQTAPAAKETYESLLAGLEAPDGWVRYCSYWSLKKLSGNDFACDWIFDKPGDRQKTVNQWNEWWKQQGKK